MPATDSTLPFKVLVAGLDALLAADGDDDPMGRFHEAVVDTLVVLQQRGVRVFLLALPDDAGDGLALDRRLTQCDRLQQMVQAAGGRIEGAVVGDGSRAGMIPGDLLVEVARRAQVRVADVCLVTRGAIESGEAGRNATLLHLAEGADFPGIDDLLRRR